MPQKKMVAFYICDRDHYAKNCPVREVISVPPTWLAAMRVMEAPQHSYNIYEEMKVVEACLSKMTKSQDIGLPEKQEGQGSEGN